MSELKDDFKRFIWEDRTLARLFVGTLVALAICLVLLAVSFGWAGVALGLGIVAASAGTTLWLHFTINHK